MPPKKKQRIDSDGKEVSLSSEAKSNTLDAPISPPARKAATVPEPDAPPEESVVNSSEPKSASVNTALPQVAIAETVPSPVSLVRVAALEPSENVDTVGLGDLLGDPLIKECWAFNYLFDVEWLLTHFDEDVRDLVRLNIVHGSWRRENNNKIAIDAAAKAHPNVRAFTAYMPDPFGTHHTKMMVLIRHDDAAQVIICTANLIARDWRMGQAVWQSPMLPKFQTDAIPHEVTSAPAFGTGERFGFDLRSYLDAYGGRLGELSRALRWYDFSNVKACFVASTPSNQSQVDLDISTQTLWGWPALEQTIKRIPVRSKPGAHIVTQVSSIATLGVTPTWFRGHLYRAMQGLPARTATSAANVQEFDPKLSVVFPTADEIRRTIDGYACGGSIHYKLQSPAHEKQLTYLRPHLQHWAGDQGRNTSTGAVQEAGRKRTGPHIKTYIRFSDAEMKQIDWAMITSANLSKQAWGTERNAYGEVKISSFEAGVIFWPGMWEEEGKYVKMVPVFKNNTPEPHPSAREGPQKDAQVTVGWRMPYDLPLVPYAENEKPWCVSHQHLEPDWMGRTWSV